jgi:hypothetical protein
MFDTIERCYTSFIRTIATGKAGEMCEKTVRIRDVCGCRSEEVTTYNRKNMDI